MSQNSQVKGQPSPESAQLKNRPRVCNQLAGLLGGWALIGISASVKTFKARHGGGKGEGAPWGAWGAFAILAALPSWQINRGSVARADSPCSPFPWLALEEQRRQPKPGRNRPRAARPETRIGRKPIVC
jgi:hypothetical protein